MSKENLDNLILSFYDANEVEGVKEDIRIGDEIIASGDKLVPDEAVVSEIKGDISKHLKSRQGRRMHINSMRAAVAAMIVLGAFIGIRTFIHQGPDRLDEHISRSFFWGNDATASGMASELEEMDWTMTSISIGEDETETDFFIESLEQEIRQDSGGFWNDH